MKIKLKRKRTINYRLEYLSIDRSINDIYKLPKLMGMLEAIEFLKNEFNDGDRYLASVNFDGNSEKVLPPIDIPLDGTIVDFDGMKLRCNASGIVEHEVTNIMSREKVWESFTLPYCCSVASESYWSS